MLRGRSRRFKHNASIPNLAEPPPFVRSSSPDRLNAAMVRPTKETIMPRKTKTEETQAETTPNETPITPEPETLAPETPAPATTSAPEPPKPKKARKKSVSGI